MPTAMFLEEQGTVKMDAGARTARGNKCPRASPAAAQASSPGIAGVPRHRHGSSVGAISAADHTGK